MSWGVCWIVSSSIDSVVEGSFVSCRIWVRYSFGSTVLGWWDRMWLNFFDVLLWLFLKNRLTLWMV